MLERYVYKNQKKMRCGYTTGTCACAAAKAAACMLLSGRRIESVSVITPMGVELTLPVYEITMEQDSVTCAIKKDSGDDPDVTNGILIYASVSYIERDSTDKRVVTDGGTGVEADTARKILDCVTTEAALDILKKSDMLENTMKQLMIRIEDVLQRRSGGKIRIGAIVFSNEYGILGKTKTADKLLEDIMENNYG